MKRGILIIACLLMLSTPAMAWDTAYWQEFRTRTYMYESWSHFWFSAWSYRNPTLANAKKSKTEKWWGEPIYVRAFDLFESELKRQ